MPRIARIVAVDYPHHITQRGNYQQRVFLAEEDYRRYLYLIKECSSKYLLSILAYCLMPNHVHFIVIPKKEDSLARTFNTAHMRYAQYINKKKGTRGHLWQGRFYSCILDEGHLYAGIRYVERNPVRAGLALNVWSWRWSSAKAHMGLQRPIIPLVDVSKFIEIDDWKGYLAQANERHVIDDIKKHTLVGRPLGSEDFIKKLERIFGERLIALPRGRPKKESERVG